ncbi:putative RNA-binding protein eif1ad [Lobosporangium transversale]|uniref:S1-like domain-containing protein n=1 Tax=Lobosporangium transversale TaxID=64571 RepID=A0A1Y2GDH1_9FUNG|nr:hypothetical protein BCR41DRAFT_361494 [Lobosporangium transversale]KAF9909174.1 putative RNA-binding protein eif1ad [Lobosporangium transversale]ORZ05971.1 hypothetical protein BCR41DRAFT_361494 [Lobosporangium transversale]|eukprot:XP_021877352.1 hypothetical protein BCR41DRAFT_361494 [Lobosporangium transversale]
MSRRRQVSSDILAELPELEEGQRFARVTNARGNNIHEVQYQDGQGLLVNLPPKFRNLVWVKRGSYVIIQPADEEDKTKVAGDIVAVLFPDHIKQYKQKGIWPFEDQLPSNAVEGDPNGNESGSESDKDNDLFVNNNRVVLEETDSDTDSDSDDEHYVSTRVIVDDSDSDTDSEEEEFRRRTK